MVGFQSFETLMMDQQRDATSDPKILQTLIAEDPRILWVPTATDFQEVVVYIRSGFNGKEIIIQSARPVVARHIEDEARTANLPPSPELTDTTAGASEKSNSTDSDKSVPTPDMLFQEAKDGLEDATRSWIKLLSTIGIITLLLLLTAAGIVWKLPTRTPRFVANLVQEDLKAAGLTSDVPAIFEALSHKDQSVGAELKAIQDVLYSSKAGITSPSLLVEGVDGEAYDFGQLLQQVNHVKDIDRALLMFWFAREDATAMCGNMLRKRILSSDAYEILVNQSISQFCAAEHIDGLVYGHPMFGGSSSSPPQILEDQFDDSDGMYLTVDGDADTQAALDFHGDADLVQEYEAPAPSYSTKVFLECGK